MDDINVSSIIADLMKNGGIKTLSDDGKLENLTPDIDEDETQAEEADSTSYIKSVEDDFRNNADDLLKRIDLSHLRV